MGNKKLTLIDGTSLIYSSCYNNSVNEDKADNFIYYKESLEYYIENILESTKADMYLIFGDHFSSYRKRLFSEYKADRKKNKQYMKFKNDLLHYAKESLGFYMHNDLEADDLCLIAHNLFKDEYDVTIASKDSDLRQYPAKFFNYGIYRKANYTIEEAFEVIDENKANLNLWKSVLISGHNNKLDYLEGCGIKTADAYLNNWEPSQYRYAVLRAFIEGIDKDSSELLKRSVKGYGNVIGTDKYNKSFQQTYLFRTLDEIKDLGFIMYLPDPMYNSNKLEI